MCGILGYCAREWDPAIVKFFGLQGFNLQHRGQENFGCTYSNGSKFSHFKDRGLVSQVFTRERRDEFTDARPLIAIAQTRYATAGGTDAISAQPHWMTLLDGFYSNATNGDLPLLKQEIDSLESMGTVMLSGNDGEVILKKILHGARRNGGDLVAGIRSLMETTPGAYSGCLMTLTDLYLYRDPHGFRPLYYGRWRDAVVFSSESCAFHEKDAHIEREVFPGEVIHFDIHGNETHHQAVPTHQPRQQCIFEAIYFARPDSRVFGDDKQVGHFRYLLGRQLAKEDPVKDDAVVVPVPDSGRYAASGYAAESGLPLREMLVRNPYIPRTFQIAGQANREDLVRLKFTVMQSLLQEYRRFVVVDDSLVRSTTLRILIEMIHDAAKPAGVDPNSIEVHVRIASPPIVACCYYGIDTPEMKELVAAHQPVADIAAGIGAASLDYLSLAGLDTVAEAFGRPSDFCHACFTARYPTPFLVRSR